MSERRLKPRRGKRRYMRLAREGDLSEVMEIVRSQKKFLGHVRKDVILNHILRGECAVGSGYFIAWTKYRRASNFFGIRTKPGDNHLRYGGALRSGMGIFKNVMREIHYDFMNEGATYVNVREDNEDQIGRFDSGFFRNEFGYQKIKRCRLPSGLYVWIYYRPNPKEKGMF